MLISRNLIRTLKVVVTSLAILATVTFQANGQSEPQFFSSTMLSGPNDVVEDGNGLTAFRSGKLDEAIFHFQHAVSLNPNDATAKMWLGELLARKVAPGIETPENLTTAQRAIFLYREVISNPSLSPSVPLPSGIDQSSITVIAMRQIARINFNIEKLDESKAWQKKVLAEEPKDAEAAFAVGVIDCMEANQNAQMALAKAGIKDDGEGNVKAPASVMDTIKAQNGALVEEALQYLHQAVENRPDYDNAMTFLGLAYRRKADMDWADEAARKADLLKAVEWHRNAINAQKSNQKIMSAAVPPAKL
jgi:tetratricopeptide (TPR) repeat protein